MLHLCLTPTSLAKTILAKLIATDSNEFRKSDNGRVLEQYRFFWQTRQLKISTVMGYETERSKVCVCVEYNIWIKYLSLFQVEMKEFGSLFMKNF